MSAPDVHRSRPKLDHNSGDIREFCDVCARETFHEVAIELASLAREATGDDQKYANEPRRVTTCRDCGAESKSWITRE